MFKFEKIGAYSTMKIRILDGRVIDKKPRAVGDILEVPASAAVEFIYRGWAEKVIEVKTEKPDEEVKPEASAAPPPVEPEVKKETPKLFTKKK